MNETLDNLQEQEKILAKTLAELPKEKWKIWRLFALGIILPFVGPYVPMRKGMLADRMGFENSALLFGVMLVIIIPIGCYIHFQKINYKIYDAEVDLKIIRRKISKIMNN